MKVLVISDTHGFTPVDLKGICFDALIHAGDIGSDEFFLTISSCEMFYAVEGNTDYISCTNLPETLCDKIDGVSFFLVHNLTSPSPDRIRSANNDRISACSPDIVIFGHTHTPLITERDGIVFLNPGSLGKQGLTGINSYAIMETDAGSITEITVFDAHTGNRVEKYKPLRKG
jgi:uncharacterized protein